MKGLLLLSDGIDSPVAGYLMIKKNIEISAVHFLNSGFSDNNSIKKIEMILKILSNISKKSIKLYIIDHQKNQDIFYKKCKSEFQCILCKTIMHKISERIAIKEKIDFIISGENLGQVASQTLSNMTNIHKNLNIPVLQPLLIMDKEETKRIAKEIKTYEISIKEAYKCPYVPNAPKTKSDIKSINLQINKVEIDKMINNSLSEIKIKNISNNSLF
jgi:tRNA uracil 4-sulfurtransferase